MKKARRLMDDSLKFALGAVSAIAGGVITQIIQARYAGKKKLDELVAEKRVEVCIEEYILMKRVQSALATMLPIAESDLNVVLNYFLLENEEWLLRSRLFLPGKFPDLWFAIRNEIVEAKNMEHNSTGSAAYLKRHLLDLVEEAISEIYSLLGQKIIRPEIYQRRRRSLKNRYRFWKERRKKVSSDAIYKFMNDAPQGTSLVDRTPKDINE